MNNISRDSESSGPQDTLLGPPQDVEQTRGISSKPEAKTTVEGAELEPPKEVSHFSGVIHNWWLFEATALFVSCGFFAITVGVLSIWNTQYVLDWGDPGFTLHGMITFLATLTKAAMFITITACTGQLKWHHFSKDKANPVIDMDRIESVGRGATGSVMYLLRFGFLRFVSLAATLTIAGLLLGSAMVNMLDQTQSAFRPIPLSPDVKLGATNHYSNASSVDTANENFYPVTAMQVAAITGWWYQDSDRILNQIFSNSFCSSGYCEWDSVSTLAVRSQCVPAPVEPSGTSGVFVSSQANISNIVATSNLNQSTSNAIYNLIARHSAPAGSIFAKNGAKAFDGAVIVHVAAIGSLPGAEDKYEAAECILYWAAVKTERPYTANSIFQSLWYIDEEFNTTEQANSSSSDIVINPTWSQEPGCHFGDRNFSMHDPACEFRVANEAHRGIQNFMSSFLTINEYTEESANGNSTKRTISNDAMNAFGTQVSRFGSISDALNTFLSVTTQFMTTEISRAPALLDGRLQDGAVIGTLFRSESIFTVRWLWAIYPAVMLLATGLLFALTVWHSRKEAIWKNSFLPTLYHGLGARDDSETYDVRELAGMEEVAKKQTAIMETSDDWTGKRLKVVR